MPQDTPTSTFEVTSAEAGQKLLQFLSRRLNLPQSMLHRWIRTGQIRRNGGRCKPFDLVSIGDMVRLPPFALSMHNSTLPHPVAPPPQQASSQVPLPPLPAQVHADTHLIVFNKPSGLPVHPGTGHSDSLSTRLSSHYASLPFAPTPAHRLDKDTSGVLLVALSYSTLRALQDAFKERTLGKEYLAWVHGQWPHTTPTRLTHYLGKRFTGGDEKVHVIARAIGKYTDDSLSTAAPDDSKEAACIVACLRREPGPHGGRSLMHIRLLTGRTHQIRVQLAAEGHPLCGDVKYGAPPTTPPISLRLHALRLTLPPVLELKHLPQSFAVLPPWEGPWKVENAPEPLTASLP